MSRDPRDVLRQIIDVIPEDEGGVRDHLRGVLEGLQYSAPEVAAVSWWIVHTALNEAIGQPQGRPWADRVARIVADKDEARRSTP